VQRRDDRRPSPPLQYNLIDGMAPNLRRGFDAFFMGCWANPQTWPRELRHALVSLLSSSGVPIEDTSHLVGHSSTVVTETVYRKELRPVLTRGARAMNALFDGWRA
jgi:integrase